MPDPRYPLSPKGTPPAPYPQRGPLPSPIPDPRSPIPYVSDIIDIFAIERV